MPKPPLKSPWMRQGAKRVAQVMGIHPWLRDINEKIYWTLENWQAPVLKQLAQILKVPIAMVQSFSAEYDASGLWENIFSQITAVDYWHGTSSEQDLRRLYILCRVLKPRIVIETGVASGASSWCLLLALHKNEWGNLYSIDLPMDQWSEKISEYRKFDKVVLPPQKEPGWLVPESLKSRWHFMAGDSRVELPKLLELLGSCHLFYHDAEHTYEAMIREYQTVWPYLTYSGVLASDDIDWSSAFREFARGKDAYSWRGFGMIRKGMDVLTTQPGTLIKCQWCGLLTRIL